MTKWYVESVYTHDDSGIDRRRKYGEFDAPPKTPVTELAVLALVSIGFSKDRAEQEVKSEADLDGTTVEDGGFEFNFWDNNGQYEVSVSQEPIPKAAAYVVVVNNQPIAVRPWPIDAVNLQEIAATHRLPVASLSVVKVEDVLG